MSSKTQNRSIRSIGTRISALLLAAPVMLVVFSNPSARAASASWTGATDSTWAGTGNWSATPVPGTGDTATFNAASANTTIDLGGGVTLSSILFDTSGAAAYTIGSGAVGAQTVTIDNSNGGLTVSPTVANNQLVNANVILGTTTAAATYNLTNGSSQTLTVAGSITGGAAGGTAGIKTLSVLNSGAVSVSGAIAKGGATGVTIAKNGTGTLTLGGGDLLAGGAVNVNNGTVNLNGVLTNSGGFTVGAASTTATLALGGAAAFTNSAGFFNLGTGTSGNGILKIASGGAAVFNGANGGNFAGSATSSGALYNDGTFLITGTVANNCGTYIGNSTTSYGYFRSTGTATVSGRMWVAQGSGAVGVLDLLGGTTTVSGINQSPAFQVSANSATTASSSGINVNGGTLSLGGSAAQTFTFNTGNNNYTAVNVVSGGKITMNSGFGFNLLNTGNANNFTTLTLASGGELDTQYTFNNNTTYGACVMNFDNGILKATATDGNGLIINNTAVYVYSGGATLDANGFNPKINVPILAPSGSGVTSISLSGTTTGYIGAPLVKITGGGGKGAAAIANFNPSSGTITGITVTAPGSGYTSAPTVTLVGGNGGSTGANAGTATATATIGAVSSGGLNKIGNGTLILNAANTYTGNTVVSAGTLSLQTSGSLASGNIIVSNNATFDVSSISFTLGGSQGLLGYGTNNGAVNTTSGSKIYAGTDGGYGTNTFNGNLTLIAGAVCYFDLTTNYNGSNDFINVVGSLVDNGSVQISAPSASVNLNTNQDYVLITAAGGVSGTISPTPLWGVKPLNWRNFTVVQNGNNIQLHYTASTPPVATGSASPATVLRNQSTVVSVTVTPGTGSIDPNTGVSLDASALGLSSVYLVLSSTPNVYTNTITVPASATAGNYTLNTLVTDSTPLTGSANVALTVVATNQVWNGTGANNLSDNNTNWVSGSAPGFVGDAMTFAGTVNTSPDLDQNYTVTGVTFNTNAGTFTISTAESNTLTLTNGTGVVNNSTNAQTLNVPLALSTTQTFNAASANLNVPGGISGTGGLTKLGNQTMTLTGANSYTGQTTVGAGTMTFSGSSSSIGNLMVTNGQLNVTAGTVNVNDTTGNLTKLDGGASIVVSGGSLNIGGTGGWFPVGNTAGTTSTLTVSGGAVNVLNSFGTEIGRIGSGVLTINSGSFLNNDVNAIGFIVGDQATATSGTVNLNGGTLTINKLLSNNGTNNFYFNGGTLQPTANNNTTFWQNSAKLTASVRNGGAIVDAAGFFVTIAQPLVHSTVGGDNAIDGGLTVTNSSGTGYLTLAATNTYTGPTLVTAGYLVLGANGAISNSPSITLSNGAYFDVSQRASYALNSGQILAGSGQVNAAQDGLVTAPSGSAIYPGTDGTAGNLTINGGLTLGSGATANLDVDTTYNGANDQLTVSGTLTLNGNSLHIKAPSTSSTLDSTADYVLITASSISGSFSSTPVWDVMPVNWANYTVVTSGSQVVLHYSTLAPPKGSGVAIPSIAVHNQNVLISVTVTNGSGTVDPNTGVVLNASTIGGSSAVPLILSSTISSTVHVYTNTITVPGGALAGSYTLTAQITDSNTQIGTANIALAVTTTEIWNGAGADQNWSTNPNWVSGVSPDLTGNNLIFAGSAGTSPNMDNSYSVSGLTFSNNAASFTIGSTTSSTLTLTGGVTNNSANAQTLNVPIADVGSGLTKSGNGTLILSAVNTYTGNTTINAGSLTIGGVGQLNSGTYSAAIVDNGAFVYNSSAEQVLSGFISGTGSLTQSGAGTLVLDNSTNTLSGNITISGYLIATNNTAFNNGNGATKGPLGNPAITNRTITVNSGGTLVMAAGNVFGDGGSSVAPAVTLVINQGGAVQTAAPIPAFPGNGGGDANIFGNITLNGGTFSTGNGYANSPDYQAAILMGSVTVGGSAASTINSIASNGNANGLMLGKQGGGTVTFDVAATGAGADLIVTAPLVNSPNNTTGSLLKVGSGTLQLDAANTYAGSTTVSNGTLSGIGSIAGPVAIAPSGTIGAGDAGTNVGTLTINNSFTLQGAATFRIGKTGGVRTNDLITGISTATYGGSLVVSNITSDATPLVAGDTFTLFSAGSHSGNFASIVGSPGAGLRYSFTNGVLSVVSSVVSQPVITGISISGGTVTMSGTNGTSGQQFRVLSTTNLTLSVGSWSPIYTNTFTGGAFNFTIPVTPANAQQFYMLSIP